MRLAYIQKDRLWQQIEIGVFGCFQCSHRKTIIEQHGGSISFESKIGEGTTFKIELPKSELSLITNNTHAVLESEKFDK